MTDARARFLTLLRTAVQAGELTKLTLGRYRGTQAALRNLSVRPVALKAGPRLAFVWRYATREVAKNHLPEAGLAELESLIGGDFLDAHLFTPAQVAQLECDPAGSARLHCATPPSGLPAKESGHDREKNRLIDPAAPWLQALGVTHPNGRPLEAMTPKFRQIQKFVEILEPLLKEAGLPDAAPPPAREFVPLAVVDLGCGKGYLTFAVSAFLGDRGRVLGIEARADLVENANRIAASQGFSGRLSFTSGTIADTPLPAADVLIALHACDTATDDALAKGIAAGTKLLVVSPCCQKELRAQLASPPVLAGALRHGIFQERQAEFVTDALRAQLLEWAGYRTKVFEFVSTEHTAKNLMITAVKSGPGRDEAAAARIRAFAAFYGIKRHALARQLNFALESRPEL